MKNKSELGLEPVLELKEELSDSQVGTGGEYSVPTAEIAVTRQSKINSTRAYTQ
ncbi:MAG: hypothetical protein KA715_12030 [Xanthomonadaceae bacterium]|nr:hypothetical protein [Xanthomonadaceae bacterium]